MAAKFGIKWIRNGERLQITVEGDDFIFDTYEQAARCARDLHYINNPAWKNGRFAVFMIGIRP